MRQASPDPDAVIAGIDQRIDAMFRAEAGQSLARAAKQPPLSPGRGQFVRYYSWSLMAFASRCLYLDEQVDAANAAVRENAQHYLDNPRDISDRDSFHWHAETVLRLIDMYGKHGCAASGRLNEATEQLALEAIWLYVKRCSRLAHADVQKSKTWHVYGSENHHAMDFIVCWHFAKLAKCRECFQDRPFDDGATAAEHETAWSRYIVTYCLERARRGVCVEMMSDHYNWALIKGFYNVFDFGDPEAKRAAGQFLDLFFAYWAQEQINGVQGGGRSRIYFHEALQHNLEPGIAPIAWLYFGMGEQPAVHGFYMNAALSSYRPPAVVADIAMDVAGRGRYEVIQRAQGLGKQDKTSTRVDRGEVPNALSTDGGGIVRYTYCDPAFILGTPMFEARPLSDWTHISAQNRWQGVIFRGEHDARIVPIVRPDNNRVTLNAFWSVQCKGCLITQKLQDCHGGCEMMVWMSRDGLSDPVEKDGWVFAEAAGRAEVHGACGAYVAFREAWGDATWNNDVYTITKPEGPVYHTRLGHSMILNDDQAPVILQVMSKANIPSFEAFEALVLSSPVRLEGSVLHVTSIYGDAFTFDTSQQNVATINREPVNYEPQQVFASPFLNSGYETGIVTIRKGQRKCVLDFNH